MIEITSHSEQETREIGRRLGERLTEGVVIGLSGTLGTGKTRLTQGIGMGLGVPAETITSPTYTLCVPHLGRLELVHIDAYRISDDTEVDELGLDELIEDGAVLVIEWAERIATALPPIDLQILLEHNDDQSRTIWVEGRTEKVNWLGKKGLFPEAS
jgi:tRNA threonylcarbamoyladenosine biosynthesis protein TsaE